MEYGDLADLTTILKDFLASASNYLRQEKFFYHKITIIILDPARGVQIFTAIFCSKNITWDEI